MALENAQKCYRIEGTPEYGIHSGRRRYLVQCLECGKVLHRATTGPECLTEGHDAETCSPAEPEEIRRNTIREAYLWLVHAQVVPPPDAGGWRSTAGVPSFILDGDTLGITCAEHAERIARRIVDPLGVAEKVHCSVARYEPF